jgi:hypothetical protein
MTNEFKELESKIRNSHQGVDYSVHSDSEGRRTYSIFSDGLKQSLRDVVRSTVFGWQISHTLGKNFIEYKQEQSGKFGLYRKSLLVDDNDQFLIIPEGKISAERENFEETRQRAIESEKRVLESEQRVLESEKRAIESEKRVLESEQRLENDNSKSDNYVSFSVEWNEKGEKVSTAEKYFANKSEEQAFKDGPGWKMAQAVAKAMAEVQASTKDDQNQQTQIIHKEQPKLPSPQDKGGSK